MVSLRETVNFSVPPSNPSGEAEIFDPNTVERKSRSAPPWLRAVLAPPSAFVLIAVWIAAAVYVSGFVNRGWVPHDEGILAQSAERVLMGELPHRDYDESYTGGLTYLHATALLVFGVKLSSLRIVLLLAFLAFVPAVYAIALRASSPVTAGLITLLVVAWSVPNYFASLPSWYNLFFATFGILALFRHIETGRRRWLFIAGVFVGLSILCKVVGFYDVMAVLLFLVYREQTLALARAEAHPAQNSAFLFSKIFGGAALIGFLVALVAERLDLVNAIHFILPGAAVVALLVLLESRKGSGTWSQRWRSLLGLVTPFLLGVVIPLLILVVPYFLAGALRDLLRGVFVQPLKQIGTARMDLPPARALLPALPYALTLAYLRPGTSRRRNGVLVFALAIALGLLLVFATNKAIYQTIWFSARSLDVVAVVVGCLVLATSSGLTDRKRQELFLLTSATALVSLVQFPFAAPIYFCYVAPLAALTILSIVSASPQAPRRLHLCVLVFYLLFAVLFTNRGYLFNLGAQSGLYEAHTPLRLPRAGLRVPADEARTYEALISMVLQKSAGGAIYAGPDCPEVYFLSGRRNPTRFFFDFLGDLYGHPNAVLRLLEENGVKVVVLNKLPSFSRKSSRVFRTELRRRYPHSTEIGKFTVMWRD